MTKGIIISGGWGTRLRPLTCTIPKSLIPVVNKPVIERQILLLKSAGIKDIVLAVSVMSDILKAYFGDGDKLGINIQYTDEKKPLGTAGAIKLAEDYLKDENFFMLNGDVILNFDFKVMVQAHARYKGLGVIASKIVPDPSRYGVLIVEEESNKILKFLEKSEYSPPDVKNIPMPINAGVYILEPDIFQYIKPNKKVSIEHDVFPILVSEERLYHYSIPGVWKDIGKPEELLEGNIQLMNDMLKNLQTKKENLIDESLDVEGKVLIKPPVTIGENVVIRKNCQIGPNVIIGDNVYIGANTEIKDSLIYNETYFSENVKCEKTIIADNCLLHDGVQLIGNNQNLVILSSYVEVLDNIRLIAPFNNSLAICHHEVVRLDVS
ncbi:MAG: NDP-sugar synthase [Candidatus Lokiarchaeota archaeon]|nr:NDP-sugar synthase [Candidatus Lokiarchaeota archaeon]